MASTFQSTAAMQSLFRRSVLESTYNGTDYFWGVRKGTKNMKNHVTFKESIASFAACEFLQVVENFMRRKATIRDVDNVRKFFVMQTRLEFGLSDRAANAVVRRVEWQCKLLGNACSNKEVIAAIRRVKVQAGLLQSVDDE